MVDGKMIKLKNEIDEKIEQFVNNSVELKKFISLEKIISMIIA